MLAGRPSRTLLGPAVRRAAHQLLDAPLVFSDPIAVGLIPEADAETIRAQLADHQTAESILLRSLFVLRSRFAEDRLAEAASRGVRQYVIFGAGLETFPWRQPEYARNHEDLCSRPYVELDLVADQVLGARPPQADECCLRSARSRAKQHSSAAFRVRFCLGSAGVLLRARCDAIYRPRRSRGTDEVCRLPQARERNCLLLCATGR